MRLFWLGPMSVLAGTALAQWAGSRPGGDLSAMGRNGIVRGEVVSDAPIVGLLTVELISPGHGATFQTEVQGDGRFQFSGLEPGQYDLRVTGRAGTLLHEEMVVIGGGNQNLTIQLGGVKLSKTNAGTVSIHQLTHKIPPKAQKEFEEGQSASRKGGWSSALKHYQEAAAIDPEFADAYAEMGSAYAALGQLARAAEQYGKAVELAPDHNTAVANLSIVLCELKRYHEAAALARRALRLRPTMTELHYVLGVSLAEEGGDPPEALANLLRSASEFPEAHLLAAKILIDLNRRSEAIEHLERYLHSSPAGQEPDARQEAEMWLAQLQQQP
ncbi:MAG TPA: tetratricopeptide repeat protein [Bryobacteraceae bacterium]|nr:tetratricopeptide repeat protein [Bryobacteraceae bacterium]